jgi:hypothetical protein
MEIPTVITLFQKYGNHFQMSTLCVYRPVIRSANTFTIISNRCHLTSTASFSASIVRNQVTTQQSWYTRTWKFIRYSNKNKIPVTYRTASTEVRMSSHKTQHYDDTTNQLELLLLRVSNESRDDAYMTRYCNIQVQITDCLSLRPKQYHWVTRWLKEKSCEFCTRHAASSIRPTAGGQDARLTSPRGATHVSNQTVYPVSRVCSTMVNSEKKVLETSTLFSSLIQIGYTSNFVTET